MQVAPKNEGSNGKHIRKDAQRFGLLAGAGILLALLIAVVATPRSQGESDHPLILRSPSLSRTDIAFESAGYIWIVPRDGGDARQITIGGHEGDPIFSPDGSQIAFEGEYNGN